MIINDVCLQSTIYVYIYIVQSKAYSACKYTVYKSSYYHGYCTQRDGKEPFVTKLM